MAFQIKQLPVIKFERKGGTELYDIRFGDYSWAFLMINEEIGIVSIVSDYGNWSYIWPPKNHGDVSLKHFIARGDCDYMAGKFMGADARRQFDCEGTIEELKKHIIKCRMDRTIDEDEARDLFNDVESMDTGLSEEGFWNDLNRDVANFLESDYYSYARYKPTSELLWLRDGILPAIVEQMKRIVSAEATL